MSILEFLSTVQAPGPSRFKPQSLSPDLQEHLQQKLKVENLSKDEYLLKAGQTSKSVTFIESGLLRCYYLTDSGKEVNRWFMREGDVVFSINSFYTQKPGQEYIQALEPAELFYITYDELDEIYFKFPDFRTIGLQLTSKYYMLWDQKEYAVLAKPASERYEWLVTNHQELLQRVADKHLASWLGITDVTFSQIKSKR